MAAGYLRYPHVHGDLITFVAGDDVWLFDTGGGGGRAWRLSGDTAQVSYPRFSRDGTKVAWTSWRDGSPEVYACDIAGGDAARLTFWGDPQTRVTGWTADGDVLAVTSAGQQAMKYWRAFAVPGHGDAPPRLLPFGPVNDLALEPVGTALLTGSVAADPAYWKRYRGGRAGKLWIATAGDPLFTRILSGVNGQLASPMLIGGRLFFLCDHEGTGNIYSCALDGAQLRRHTDHDGMYARNPSTDGHRIVYHVAGDIWMLDGPDAPSPRKLDIYVIRMAARLRSLAWTIGLGLLLGGAAGNLADRLFRAPGPLRGSVVDWLNLPHFAWTFNLADAAVTCAAVLIGILTLLGVRIDGAPAADAAPDTRGEQATGTP